jgi:hypothetical protein
LTRYGSVYLYIAYIAAILKGSVSMLVVAVDAGGQGPQRDVEPVGGCGVDIIKS